jgi:ABC-type bacteriocin/lantibiotic exporter with double-glycine peptidase domain
MSDKTEPALSPETEKLKERLKNRKPSSMYCLLNRWLFCWMSPIMDYCTRTGGIDFDMMNKLETDQFYANYSNKIDYYLKKHKRKWEGKKAPKSFYLRVILDCFKWDFFLQVFCIIIISIMGYSSSYFIQKIFEIQYLAITSSEKVQLFALYIFGMLFFKVIIIVSNNNLGWLMTKFGTKTYYATSHMIIKQTMHTSFVQNSKYSIGDIINLGNS